MGKNNLQRRGRRNVAKETKEQRGKMRRREEGRWGDHEHCCRLQSGKAGLPAERPLGLTVERSLVTERSVTMGRSLVIGRQHSSVIRIPEPDCLRGVYGYVSTLCASASFPASGPWICPSVSLCLRYLNCKMHTMLVLAYRVVRR